MAVQIKEKQPSDVETEQLATGCEAIAEAIRLADVDVMAAYPIRPYDGVMQAAAKLIANGKMDVEYIVADGEHSQFGAGVFHDLELAVLAVRDDVFDVHLPVRDELRGGLHHSVVGTDRVRGPAGDAVKPHGI